ncbi:D-alanyl-D-alanine carboxypeptidase/D-alanyl-D-alanine endopeptidase [Amycolatopsis benzoatilytica]|uniref:D-alanyl-D-alanine carboxypeptidase/D-alanyl-D-alanine endopeptidase n=1 Tax=Amycolatopsis benzoatilytica TaxID=346045 RepID=UPI000375ED85|nr:D-alanyl-D-alanine carboxypeptidase/D-alanyl-D-alanine-endopeptidase [Amycolatopsis benzoatilytica]
MPDNDQPTWPTGDEDTSSSGDRATTRLPLPKRDAGATAQLSVPNVTPGDGPGSWFRPSVPAERVPGLNAPAEPRDPDVSGTPDSAPAQPKPSAPWVPVEGPTQFVTGVPRPGAADSEATVQAASVEGDAEKTVQAGPRGRAGSAGGPSWAADTATAAGAVGPDAAKSEPAKPVWAPDSAKAAAAAEGTAEQTVRAQSTGAAQPQQSGPASSGSAQVGDRAGQPPAPQQSSPAWQPVRKPGNSLFDPAGAAGSGEEPGRKPFQSVPPAEATASQEFSAFHDETPGTGENNQGWAAFRPAVAHDQQSDEPPKEGWTAFRSEPDAAESASGTASGAGQRPSGNQPGSSAGQRPAGSELPGSSRTDSPSENRAAFASAAGSAAAEPAWPDAEEEGRGRPGEQNQPGVRSGGQPGAAQPGVESAAQPGSAASGHSGASEAEPWSQRIEIPVRPGLPEPAPGTVPPAGSGAVRPMRIDPSGGQSPAEATIGIPRPAGWPASAQSLSEATVGFPRPPEGFPRADEPYSDSAQRPQSAEQRLNPEPSASPAVIPPQATGDETPPEPPVGATPAAGGGEKKPRRKVLVLSLVVLLVLAAAGGASAVPAVANKLGLPWAPNAPKGSDPEPAEATLALHGPDTSGPGASASGVSSALSGPAGAGALAQLSGSVIDPSTGTVLWDHSSNTPLTPASTTKILTVSAALLAMDPTKRLTTKIVQGAQPGTVVLVGGGDPTLTALPVGTDSPLYPGAAHIDDLVNQVKKAGGDIKKVQVDVSAYSGPVTAPGWEPGDAPSLYGAPIVPVMADGGRGNPKADETMRASNPATAVTQLVADKLGATSGGVGKAPDGAKVLGEVQSAPLPDLAYALLQISDNVLADALGRQVAIATGGDPSFAGASAAVKKVLADHGFDVNGLQLFDTSGLSNQNKVPARLLAQVLAAAAGPDGKDPNTPKLRPLLAGLPVAGSPIGTLSGRYQSGPTQAGKGWVRAKTGTLTGVNTLAGYVLDSDNRVLAFAFMSNGSDKNSGQAALDALATALRGCGCK